MRTFACFDCVQNRATQTVLHGELRFIHLYVWIDLGWVVDEQLIEMGRGQRLGEEP